MRCSRDLVDIQYERNDINFTRGTFRVRGDVLEIFPASRSEQAIRVEFFGDEIDRIREIDVLTGEILGDREHIAIFPASHYVTRQEVMQRALKDIEAELDERLAALKSQDKLLEAQRLEQRTRYDMEMMQGDRFLFRDRKLFPASRGQKGRRAPLTLLDYFPDDFLTIIDESHVTVPQIGGMYKGDRSARRCWWTTAFDCLLPWTTGLCNLRSLKNGFSR